jgi:hypothetical protein
MSYVGSHPGWRTGSGQRREEFVSDRNSHRVFVRSSNRKIVERDDEALRIWHKGCVRVRRQWNMMCSFVWRYGLYEGGRVSAHGHVMLSFVDGWKQSE